MKIYLIHYLQNNIFTNITLFGMLHLSIKLNNYNLITLDYFSTVIEFKMFVIYFIFKYLINNILYKNI